MLDVQLQANRSITAKLDIGIRVYREAEYPKYGRTASKKEP